MVYSNAELTKAEQAREVIAFADYWQQVCGADPGLLVFDSKLTTYKVLDELTARGIRWLTLREPGPKLIADLEALPDTEWKKVRARPPRALPRTRDPRRVDPDQRHRQSRAPTPAAKADAQPARSFPPLVCEPHDSFARRAVTAAIAIAWPLLSGSSSPPRQAYCC